MNIFFSFFSKKLKLISEKYKKCPNKTHYISITKKNIGNQLFHALESECKKINHAIKYICINHLFF